MLPKDCAHPENEHPAPQGDERKARLRGECSKGEPRISQSPSRAMADQLQLVVKVSDPQGFCAAFRRIFASGRVWWACCTTLALMSTSFATEAMSFSGLTSIAAAQWSASVQYPASSRAAPTVSSREMLLHAEAATFTSACRQTQPQDGSQLTKERGVLE